MKRLILVAGVLAALIAPPSLAGEPFDVHGHWCPIRGTFVGESPMVGASWLVSFPPGEVRGGTFTIRFIGGDATLNGRYPTAVEWSETMGVWQRIGAGSWYHTMLTYGLDATGQPLYVIKNSGISEFGAGCDEYSVDATSAVYDGTQDPFGDEPPMWGCTPVGPSTARRLTIEPNPTCY